MSSDNIKKRKTIVIDDEEDNIIPSLKTPEKKSLREKDGDSIRSSDYKKSNFNSSSKAEKVKKELFKDENEVNNLKKSTEINNDNVEIKNGDNRNHNTNTNENANNTNNSNSIQLPIIKPKTIILPMKKPPSTYIQTQINKDRMFKGNNTNVNNGNNTSKVERPIPLKPVLMPIKNHNTNSINNNKITSTSSNNNNHNNNLNTKINKPGQSIGNSHKSNNKVLHKKRERPQEYSDNEEEESEDESYSSPSESSDGSNSNSSSSSNSGSSNSNSSDSDSDSDIDSRRKIKKSSNEPKPKKIVKSGNNNNNNRVVKSNNNPKTLNTSSSLKKRTTGITTKSNSNNANKSDKEKFNKHNLVKQFLQRWWFAIEDWPPAKFDYSSMLKEKNLRLVKITDWKIVQDIDQEGFSKCIELNGFPGVFRDFKGVCYDLRPKELCPSYNNFMEKDEKTVFDYLIQAYKNQISKLEGNEKICHDEIILIESLKLELDKAKNIYNRRFLE